MFTISTPELVSAARRAGVVGAYPMGNARGLDGFSQALARITELTWPSAEQTTEREPGPLAVNLSTRLSGTELQAYLAECRRHGVAIIITAAGDPGSVVPAIRDAGMAAFHDVTSLRHAEKAVAAGCDGLVCIAAGGGGQSSMLSVLSFVPAIRRIFPGTIIVAGAIADGAAVAAIRALGADLASVGTRFIASAEAGADPDYKQMLVAATHRELRYTDRVNGVPANWLLASLDRVGVDIAGLARPAPGAPRYAHLPPAVRPWRDIWSAGQGVDLIDRIEPVDAIVHRFEREYRHALDRLSDADDACNHHRADIKIT